MAIFRTAGPHQQLSELHCSGGVGGAWRCIYTNKVCRNSKGDIELWILDISCRIPSYFWMFFLSPGEAASLG